MPLQLQSLHAKLFLVFLALFLSACDTKSGGGSSGYSVQINIADADANTKTISQNITLKLSGVKLQDNDENSLSGSVVLPAGSAKTIIVYLKDAPIANQDLKLTTKATGYIDSGASIVFSVDQKLYEINLGLVKDQAGKVAEGVFAAKEDIAARVDATGKTTQQIVVNNKEGAAKPGVKITIPSGTDLMDKDGNPVRGVKLSVTNFDPEEQEALAAYPGGLNVMANATGFNIGGQPQVGEQAIDFKSAGFAAISIVDAEGNKVKSFDPAIEVAMQFKIGTKDADGNEIHLITNKVVPIWSYDEETGKWKYEQDGIAVDLDVNDGLYDVVYTVDHLSYWNLDWHYGRKCSPRFNIVDSEGDLVLSNELSFRFIVDSSPSVNKWVRYYSRADGFLDFYNAPSGFGGKFEVWDPQREIKYATLDFTHLCQTADLSKGRIFNVPVIGLPTETQSINAGVDRTSVVGDTFTQAATGYVGSGTVSYQVWDTNVATVDANGLVTSLSPGSTEVIAQISADDTYFSAGNSYILKVLQSLESIEAGDDVVKNFGVDTVFSQLATKLAGRTALYVSTDTSVATVHPGTGAVTIKTAGQTTINVSVEATEHYAASSDSYLLTVNKANETISAGSDITKTYLDGPYTQAATNILGGVSPSYSSSDTGVATVDGGGRVTIVGAGSATITAGAVASTNYNQGIDSYELTVNKAARSVNAGADVYKVTNSSSFVMTPTITPSIGANTTYESSDVSIAGVDGATGAVVLTGRIGNIDITAHVGETGNFLGANDSYTVNVGIGLNGARGDTKADLSWGAVTDATAYKLYYATESTSGLDSLSNIATLNGGTSVDINGGGTTTKSVTGLTNGTEYHFVLVAIIGGAEKGRSNEVSAIPVHISGAGKLNDTGMIVSANVNVANNAACIAGANNKHTEQDCSHGRDADTILEKDGDGDAGFDFTKLDSNGADLVSPFNPWDGGGSEVAGTRWSCVRDNHTGLIWEMKHIDGAAPAGNTPSVDNIHHKDNVYQWGGISAIGHDHQSKEGEYYDGWDSLLTGTNTESLCGFNDWRVPTINELKSIVHHGRVSPSPSIEYVAPGGGVNLDGTGSYMFPNTEPVHFWTAAPYALNAVDAWYIDFGFGFALKQARTDYNRVRLVRSDSAN